MHLPLPNSRFTNGETLVFRFGNISLDVSASLDSQFQGVVEGAIRRIAELNPYLNELADYRIFGAGQDYHVSEIPHDLRVATVLERTNDNKLFDIKGTHKMLLEKEV